MSGPLTKPVPLSDDDYARREEERIASEEVHLVEAQEPEFLPVSNVDVERVETDYDYMQAHDNFALYSETGRVF
jgi:hypothetical protein